MTALGHVEAWQNDYVLHADKATFDRNSGVLAAYGHVVLMQPDGEIMFADYAEMNQGMKDGVLRDMQAILAQNARLAANGARRTGGEINEFSHVVYSTCNLCKSDPTKPPLWQLRAAKAVQDLEHKKIRSTQDAVMGDVRHSGGVFPLFLEYVGIPSRETGVRPSRSLAGRDLRAWRVRCPAVLPGDRRPVRRNLYPDDHHQGRPADRRRGYPPPVQ